MSEAMQEPDAQPTEPGQSPEPSEDQPNAPTDPDEGAAPTGEDGAPAEGAE